MGFDGLIAPNVPGCNNLALFLDNYNLEITDVISCEPIDWLVWRKSNIGAG